MKKLAVLATILATMAVNNVWAHGRAYSVPAYHHVHHHGYHHGGGHWGRGGRNFWPGFVGGVIGGAINNGVYYSTPVVYNPVAYSVPAYYTPTTVLITPAVVYNTATVKTVPVPVVTRTPLVSAGVNVLGIGAGISVGGY